MQSEIARGASAYWFAMCGLLGLLTSSGDAATRADAVGQAMRCARHRGPDESGTWHDADVVFGFNRLSIIDVEHSHQPLRWGPSGADDRYAIVFNGEVYNYLELRAELAELGATFATEGDTEAVVAAYHHWGPAAVSRLRGMFAFTIWDTHERVLFAARDPFGIKPLFVAEGPGGIAFASEKKSLLELAPALGLGHVDRDLDAAALQHYLLLQYVPEPATLHRAIRRVESGTHVTVRPGGEPEAERYFTPVLHAGGGHGRAPPDRGRAARLGGQAHARRRHGRRVPVRRHRLDGHRGARQGAQPRPASRSPRGSTARATRRWTSRPSRPRRSACGTSSAP